MNWQVWVSLVSSDPLSVASLSGLSPMLRGDVARLTCRVVVHPCRPFVKVRIVGVAALQLEFCPTILGTSFITSDDGIEGVSVLLIKSLRAESDTSAFGDTRHEQQDTIAPPGLNAYTLTHILPPEAPVFVIFRNESPERRFAA
jgi:hypothetical protein